MAKRQRSLGEPVTVEVQAINVEVPATIHQALKVLAAQRRSSLAKETRRAIEELLAREAAR